MQTLGEDIDDFLTTANLGKRLKLAIQDKYSALGNGEQQNTFSHNSNDLLRNKKVFLNKYGIEHEEFFSGYINDAKLYPNPNGKREQIVQVIKWIVPENNEKKVLKLYGQDGKL